MINHNYCVILAGGIGTRFWPISREAKPKQFRRIWKRDETFLQLTYQRMLRILPAENIFVATLSRYKELVMENIPGIAEENIIIEPYGRNTAPTIAFSAILLKEKDPDAVMIAMPSDHDIEGDALFADTVEKALGYAASNNVLLTLGIVPTRPDTNFGYVQMSGGRQSYGSETPVRAKTFTEKPDAELAKVFFDSGEFLWNSGIFVWKASVVLDEMARCCPEIAMLWNGWESASDRESFVEKAYADSPRTSIDYALMEKSENVWVLPAKFAWSDLGSWSTLYEYASDPDLGGNAVWLQGPQVVKDTAGSLLIETDGGKLTVIQGLKDYTVIDSDKVLLICPRGDRPFQELFSELALPEFMEYK